MPRRPAMSAAERKAQRAAYFRAYYQAHREAILAKNRVVGFSTYGEQFNGMHVNQTMTGVAIFPPPSDD